MPATRGQEDLPQTAEAPHVLRVDAALRSGDLRIQAMGRILDQLTWLVPVHVATFYTVDEHLKKYARGPVVASVSPTFRADLEESLRHHLEHRAARDPFAPSRLPDPDMILATPRDLGSAGDWYVQELAAISLRPGANMYFRTGGRIVAGISLVRRLQAPALAPSELAALRRIHGYFEFCYGVCARLSAHRANAQALERLTAREREVFTMITHGESYDAIGRDLGIARATVKTHVRHTLRKLGVANRYEAMVAELNSGRPFETDGGPHGSE